jgi:2-polyprenyl-3-methyl-5-hydroxy-6-metoxy-1,4-benzoquinol methylase
MQELHTINTLLGGHRITCLGVEALLPANKRSLHICEIGCGGGDNLHAIDRWLRSRKIYATYTGIDIKKECIEFARLQNPTLPVKWITSDYRNVNFGNEKPDIIFSSLFCHHFTDEQLQEMFRWKAKQSTLGFFINDLQRNPLAYHSIRMLTSLFSRSYLVKNDAPLSVARGFHKDELVGLLRLAGLSNCRVSWKWAFRYLVICRHATG